MLGFMKTTTSYKKVNTLFGFIKTEYFVLVIYLIKSFLSLILEYLTYISLILFVCFYSIFSDVPTIIVTKIRSKNSYSLSKTP